VAATRNKGKIKEFREALADLPVEIIGLDDFGSIAEPVEDGLTFAENALLKARYYCQQTGVICLADDSGLEVDFLQGVPGVWSARYAGESATDDDNNAKLLLNMIQAGEGQRQARFRSVLAIAGPDGSSLTADGICEGILLKDLRGDGGFGYDPLFFVPELGKTFAEMSITEKGTISHRGRAFQQLKEKMRQLDSGIFPR